MLGGTRRSTRIIFFSLAFVILAGPPFRSERGVFLFRTLGFLDRPALVRVNRWRFRKLWIVNFHGLRSAATGELRLALGARIFLWPGNPGFLSCSHSLTLPLHNAAAARDQAEPECSLPRRHRRSEMDSLPDPSDL